MSCAGVSFISRANKKSPAFLQGFLLFTLNFLLCPFT
jgi:hypothetical protein